MRWVILIAMMALAVLTGCNRNMADSSPSAEASPAEITLPTHAQPKLKTLRLWLGKEELETELALSEEQVMTGMMFRTNMDEMAGMVFVFARPNRVGFWMKNCPLPLSCAYITPDGTIAEIHDLHPQDTNAINAGSDQIQFVLEVNQGWFTRHQVTTGTIVRTERGTLQETFFPQNQ